MIAQEPISDNNPSTEVSHGFQHTVDKFLLDLPCILIDEKTVYVQEIYSLVDFIDHGGIIERAVKFFDAYLRGYVVTIVALDLKTGELLKRRHRLNNDTLPCDWVLMPADYFKPKDNNDELLEFCF